MEFPTEIVLAIVDYSSIYDAVSVSQVCSRWRMIVKDFDVALFRDRCGDHVGLNIQKLIPALGIHFNRLLYATAIQDTLEESELSFEDAVELNWEEDKIPDDAGKYGSDLLCWKSSDGALKVVHNHAKLFVPATPSNMWVSTLKRQQERSGKELVAAVGTLDLVKQTIKFSEIPSTLQSAYAYMNSEIGFDELPSQDQHTRRPLLSRLLSRIATRWGSLQVWNATDMSRARVVAVDKDGNQLHELELGGDVRLVENDTIKYTYNDLLIVLMENHVLWVPFSPDGQKVGETAICGNESLASEYCSATNIYFTDTHLFVTGTLFIVPIGVEGSNQLLPSNPVFRREDSLYVCSYESMKRTGEVNSRKFAFLHDSEFQTRGQISDLFPQLLLQQYIVLRITTEDTSHFLCFDLVRQRVYKYNWNRDYMYLNANCEPFSITKPRVKQIFEDYCSIAKMNEVVNIDLKSLKVSRCEPTLSS